MAAYYNENDPDMSHWLTCLIREGLIAAGDVDNRSIKDVRADDLDGYDQCHFFAGIGGWSRALRLAGVPDDAAVWTGSCPCQPFSSAGQQRGEDDPRHLWPDFRHLIEEAQPSVVFGEQVASPLARDWIDRVSADLEGLGFEVGSADLCAAGVNSPHIRQRIYWVSVAGCERCETRSGHRRRLDSTEWSEPAIDAESDRGNGGLRHAFSAGLERHAGDGDYRNQPGRFHESTARSVAQAGGNGFWDDYEICHFQDGKVRRLEPGTFPLADGIPGRVAQLRGLGNAIVPQVAAEFILASIDAIHDTRD